MNDLLFRIKLKLVKTLKVVNDSGIENFHLMDKSDIEGMVLKCGLNKEVITEFPGELLSHMGSGLHIWLYPNQFANYLDYIRKLNFKVDSYVEIGVRWGDFYSYN